MDALILDSEFKVIKISPHAIDEFLNDFPHIKNNVEFEIMLMYRGMRKKYRKGKCILRKVRGGKLLLSDNKNTFIISRNTIITFYRVYSLDVARYIKKIQNKIYSIIK